MNENTRALWTRAVTGAVIGGTLLALVAHQPVSVEIAEAQTVDEDRTEKENDLERAKERGGISPDRLVVVYDEALPVDDPKRQRVREEARGKALHTSVALKRGVLRVANDDAAAAAERVKKLPGVRDAYPDQVGRTSLSVNDPLLSQQYGLVKIQAATAWDRSTASGISVAVLDCGVRASHPDLVGKVAGAYDFAASGSTDDRCNHGTHVAGTIGAATNNGIGIAAVAPSAQILNGKVLGDTGSGFFSDFDRGIQWAVDNGAKVINMSLGADIPCPSGTQTAVDYAWNKGAVLVAAAGNSSLNRANAPANCQRVIGVAATDANDVKATFSHFGTEVDVAAPGVAIRSTVNPDLNAGSLYANFSGTSMATPHTAGVLALLWTSSYGTSPTAVRDRLFATSDAVAGTGASWTYGRINAARAVEGASTPPPTATTSPTPTATSTRTPTATPIATSTPIATATPVTTATPRPSVPAAPTNLQASARAGYNRLTWTASTTAGVTYDVYRGTGSGLEVLYAGGVSGTRYDDRNVVKGVTYYYQVVAKNAAGQSARSNEASARAR